MLVLGILAILAALGIYWIAFDYDRRIAYPLILLSATLGAAVGPLLILKATT